MRCDHCAQEVPEGVFCTRCGAHQGITAELGDPKTREHRYAAHPGEHVAHPAIFTTLFPHLGHRKIHEFRWAFGAGLAGIVILYLAGLITAAILVAAFLVPVLYLIYLYESQVYRDEPATVIGFTFGGGIALGIVVTLIANSLVNPFASGGFRGGLSLVTIALVGVAIPIVQEIVKPLPAIMLRWRPGFTETVDGLVFGVAAGLGFALAETLIRFADVIRTLPVYSPPAEWLYPLITIAILQPLLQGSATGAIVAAVWRRGRGILGGREIGAIVMAVAAHVAFSLGSQMLQLSGQSQLLVLGWQVLIVGGLLIYIRFLLHHALLEEAAHMGFAETICPSCHIHIMAAGFCPHCGMALLVAPAHVRRSRKTPTPPPPPEPAPEPEPVAPRAARSRPRARR
jgi:hypothetical protein